MTSIFTWCLSVFPWGIIKARLEWGGFDFATIRAWQRFIALQLGSADSTLMKDLTFNTKTHWNVLEKFTREQSNNKAKKRSSLQVRKTTSNVSCKYRLHAHTGFDSCNNFYVRGKWPKLSFRVAICLLTCTTATIKNTEMSLASISVNIQWFSMDQMNL